MKQQKTFFIPLFVLLVLALFASCQSVPETISEDLAPNEYFQKAQEAVSRGQYETGLLFYHTFLERYPNDLQKGVEAEYEIAFIYYKSGDLATAKELFQAIENKYTQGGAEILPAWPRVLSAKVMAKIDEKEKALEAEAKEAAATEGE